MQAATNTNQTTFLERVSSVIVPFVSKYSKLPFSDKSTVLTDQISDNDRYVYYAKESLNAASKVALVGTALAVTNAFLQALYEQTLIVSIGTALTVGLWKLSQNSYVVDAAVKQVTTFANANQKQSFPKLNLSEKKEL